jgi:hypothetical protein
MSTARRFGETARGSGAQGKAPPPCPLSLALATCRLPTMGDGGARTGDLLGGSAKKMCLKPTDPPPCSCYICDLPT